MLWGWRKKWQANIHDQGAWATQTTTTTTTTTTTIINIVNIVTVP